MVNIRKLEAELWESADLLRAGSKLTSNQYCMPVLGLIFLRYVLVWKTFLINQIITRASAGEYRVFNETSTDYKLIVSLLKCIYGESKTSSVVMPKIKKGSIELTAAFAENLSASLKLELEFDSQKRELTIRNYQKKYIRFFLNLNLFTLQYMC